jgi:hypothetical protein
MPSQFMNDQQFTIAVRVVVLLGVVLLVGIFPAVGVQPGGEVYTIFGLVAAYALKVTSGHKSKDGDDNA